MALLDMKQTASGQFELDCVRESEDSNSFQANNAQANSESAHYHERAFHTDDTMAQPSYYAQHLNQLHEQLQQQQQDHLNHMRSAFSASREQMLDQLNRMKHSGT